MWLAYTCAVVLPAAVVPIRFDLGFSVEQGPAIVLFMVPIVLSAYFGGLGPGLLSTILSGGLAVYYVLPPFHDFHVASGFNRLQLTSLLAAGTFVSVMAQKLHRSIAQLTFSGERLLESEERFSKAFRFNPVGIVIVRMSDNRYVEVNDAFAKMIGYTREELLGHSKVEMGIMRPEQHDKYLAPLRAGGSTVNAECTMKTKEGLVRHVLTSVEVITLQGKPHRLGCIVDITDRDRMEAALSASEAEFRSMVDNAPYGIYRTVVEGGGNFVFVNPAMIKMLGYDSAEEVLALNIERQLYKAADDRAAVIALLRSQGGFTNLELHWRKQGWKGINRKRLGKDGAHRRRSGTHRKHRRRYFGTSSVGTATCTVAEDGSRGPVGRGHIPRLQQHLERHHWVLGDCEGYTRRCPPGLRLSGSDTCSGHAGCQSHQTTPYVQPPASRISENRRS